MQLLTQAALACGRRSFDKHKLQMTPSSFTTTHVAVAATAE
jgi:hypothetical protein